jgi:ribonucleoside-diphosphate reductase alpha chain
MYYLRSKSEVNATQFTVSNKKKEKETPLTPEELKPMILQSKENPDDCLIVAHRLKITSED